jgi:hypothetical protein
MEKQEKKAIHVKFTPNDHKILTTIGGGNMSEGFRIAIVWAAHFHNLGLTPDMDLNVVGLVTVSTTDNYPHD